MFKKSEDMMSLHQKVLHSLSPLREGRIREKYNKEIKEGKYSKEEVENIQKYSYHHVLESYNPHLSLARFENEGLAQKVRDSLNKDQIPKRITFPYLALSEVGPNGTCTKIVKKFKLC